MPINLSVQKLQEPCYNSRNLKTLLLSDLNYKKKGVPTHSPPKENCHDCVLDVLNQELQNTNEK